MPPIGRLLVVLFALFAQPALARTEAHGKTASNADLGRCHMDECSWSKTLSVDVIRSSAQGKLLRLVLLGGTSANSRRIAPIRWNKTPHAVYVFCSTNLPSIFMQESGRYQVDVLDFENGIPGVLESSANIYVRACYGKNISWSSDSFVRKYGFAPIPEGFDSVEIQQPLDIFAIASRVVKSRRLSN